MSLDLNVLKGVLMALTIACVRFCKTLVLRPIVLDGSDCTAEALILLSRIRHGLR